MPDERRSRLTPEDRRTQLLVVGVNFLADHPLDELSMDELARRAGVSRALLFHYFESKQGMHRAVVTTARDSLLQATAPRPELPPRERIDDTLRRFATFVRDHRGTFLSLVRGAASGDPTVRALVDEARALNAEHLREAFGDLGAPDTRAVRMALRAWVSFAEEVFVSVAADDLADDAALVAFLLRTLDGAMAAARDSAL
ncbi:MULTISPECIES: TetR/AcrR family transcriptional regulator [unclassified Microbacterium]|uniref:TetR/AcrR family transcriptional regulator n=1 Tax=unclassified Microbacterium TaxID=2609290 RepID=UPI001D6B6D75|nr:MULTISPECIES: TetR/AcrR family transcriptional regulator [unclassified Microbacterium]CAH0168884.1 HTH-type transcriptional regulator EthR [Microbacterium sp. Bi121]HWK77976.1 helix-turn-helix domain-containing protein [Microbacterium sp.]